MSSLFLESERVTDVTHLVQTTVSIRLYYVI